MVVAVRFLPILFAVLAGVTYYFSNKFDVKHKPYYQRLMSFSAGVSIVYVLLELFPTFTEGAFAINKLVFVSVPIGFISHHLAEKYIYQHNKRHQLIKNLTFEENVFSFVYHIILGIVLVTFTQQNIVKGALFAVPLITFTFVSTLPTNPHTKIKKAFLLASSTLIGTLFALFAWTHRPPWAEASLTGIALGVLLFTVIRHHIPFGRNGRIGAFTVGFLVYSILIITSWYV